MGFFFMHSFVLEPTFKYLPFYHFTYANITLFGDDWL